MSNTETGKFRRKRNKFSQVSNHCLDNDSLTLKAKGLYALIQSKIDIPGYTLYKTVLQEKFCKEGRDAFNAAWKELTNAGYLITHKINTPKGFIYEYEILDEPENNDNPTQENPDTENPHMGPHTGNPDVGNQHTNNTNNNNTDCINTNDYLYIDNLDRLKKEVEKDNENYKCSEDKIFESVLGNPNYVNILNIFDSYHDSIKNNNLFKNKDISERWVRTSLCHNDSSIAIEAEEMLTKVLKSFRKQSEQLKIVKFNTEDINDIFEIALNFYDPTEETNILDIKKYLASVVRSKFSENTRC